MNVILKTCLLSMFAAMLLGGHAISYGQENRSVAPERVACNLLTLNSLIGTVSLSLGSEKAVNNAMPCLLTLWQANRNRGTGAFYVSNGLLSAMEANPRAFFSTMANEPKVLAEWLHDLPDVSFTWSEEPPCGLEEKRRQLVSLLRQTQIRDRHAFAVKQKVLQRLSTIRCRQID